MLQWINNNIRQGDYTSNICVCIRIIFLSRAVYKFMENSPPPSSLFYFLAKNSWMKERKNHKEAVSTHHHPSCWRKIMSNSFGEYKITGACVRARRWWLWSLLLNANAYLLKWKLVTYFTFPFRRIKVPQLNDASAWNQNLSCSRLMFWHHTKCPCFTYKYGSDYRSHGNFWGEKSAEVPFLPFNIYTRESDFKRQAVKSLQRVAEFTAEIFFKASFSSHVANVCFSHSYLYSSATM